MGVTQRGKAELSIVTLERGFGSLKEGHTVSLTPREEGVAREKSLTKGRPINGRIPGRRKV